ncbi:N-hydroxyarylamine O-acetyltransferase [Novosphingobium sp. SG751A]|uniref:arylamine N-acetyltransferase family protein n=1 Tax=Novosphingobium sp. SG751A TaxID=2587000 RepID=UPI001551FD3D|nr:arylamine N-acetyltransferase [Novosphingobium sp. SG751A]NOW46860.1 N-hydroxyarylamine O-acetyltransferase [Novosphingobium sp. SG751A]
MSAPYASLIPADADRLGLYLARIGLAAPVEPTAQGLAILQRAHRMNIGFENMDVMLGRGISLDPDAIFGKLVMGARGGYCFEQNWLFGTMLAQMGFANRPLLARVWLGLPEDAPASPLTHTFRLVDLDGQAWIADAGFGGSYVPPMPLTDGATAQTADGAQHRIIRHSAPGSLAGEWLVERLGPAAATDGRATAPGWQKQYSFNLNEVAPIDLELSNHWTFTKPETRFTTAWIASIVLEDGFAALNGRRLTMYAGGRGDVMDIAHAQDWRAMLADLFRVELSEDEAAGLKVF